MFKTLKKSCRCGSTAQAYPVILNALVWAAMMLASAWLTTPREGRNSGVMMSLFICGWIVTNSLVSKTEEKDCEV